MAPLLELRNVSVHFGPVHAVNDVSLTVNAGDILALCGDNGAGKSVLIKAISGVHKPTSGQILLDGKPVVFASPRDALRCGIATIYQDLALAQRLSIWQNVFLGFELTKPLAVPFVQILDKKLMREKAREYLSRLQIALPDMDAWVNTLSGGERQAVAIARALRWQAKLVIMDEPTAALGVKEAARVLTLIQALRDTGVTIILISHNMPEVARIASRVVILHSGRKVVDREMGDLTPERLAHMIVSGSPLSSEAAA